MGPKHPIRELHLWASIDFSNYSKKNPVQFYVKYKSVKEIATTDELVLNIEKELNRQFFPMNKRNELNDQLYDFYCSFTTKG